MSGLQSERDDLFEECRMAAKEIKGLRLLLCLSYCSSLPYLDDGEMQDNSRFPFIDFKRDSVEMIRQKMRQRTAKGKLR